MSKSEPKRPSMKLYTKRYFVHTCRLGLSFFFAAQQLLIVVSRPDEGTMPDDDPEWLEADYTEGTEARDEEET
uniref:Uncharacterized protein n=1 Tax=Romanomermis culicivorax TaxID=13658 RepID=A0A915I5R4_ROMCU